MDTDPDYPMATPYSSDAAWSKVIKAADDYLRVAARLLHKGAEVHP
jgi:hypothetical protein